MSSVPGTLGGPECNRASPNPAIPHAAAPLSTTHRCWGQRLGANKIRDTQQSGTQPMSVQIVMDYTGDTRHFFDADDALALAKAEERFKKLTGRGFTAAVRTGPDEVARITSFDPAAEETVFFPRLVGG